MGKKKVTPTEAIEAIKQTRGLVHLAANRLGVAASTLYRLADANSNVQAAIDDSREAIGDMAEGRLYQAIADGAPWAIMFYLRVGPGKHRGYIERQQVEHSGTSEVQVFNHSNAIGSLAAASVGHLGTE